MKYNENKKRFKNKVCFYSVFQSILRFKTYHQAKSKSTQLPFAFSFLYSMLLFANAGSLVEMVWPDYRSCPLHPPPLHFSDHF